MEAYANNIHQLRPKAESKLHGLLHANFGTNAGLEGTYENGKLTIQVENVGLEDYHRLVDQVRTSGNHILTIQLVLATR